MKNKTLESLIEMAIKNEEVAYASYMELYGIVADKSNPWLLNDSLHCRTNAIPDLARAW